MNRRSSSFNPSTNLVSDLENKTLLKSIIVTKQIQNAINQGRQMQQAYEDSYASMGYSSPAERAADTPTGTLGRV